MVFNQDLSQGKDTHPGRTLSLPRLLAKSPPIPSAPCGAVNSGYTASLRGPMTSLSHFLFLRLKNVTPYYPNNNRWSFLSNNLPGPVFLLLLLLLFCSGMNGSRTNTNWA